ncbi:MAG: hypothetical protein H0V17_32835 [Deltaproteobacteria bacterium]|nr:hypothetical protein [Deltaproteobacteria bacterium]
MRRSITAMILSLAACGGSGDPPADPDGPVDDVAPAFRNAVDLPDSELALQALGLLGADVPGTRESCNECHGMTRQHLSYWRALSDTAMTSCFTDLAVSSPESARGMIDCLRSMPGVDGSDYDTTKLGVFSTATDLPWFRYTMEKAYGADAVAKQAELEEMVGMPRGGSIPRFTQAEFDIVAEWFARGLPTLEQSLTEDPPPDECLPGISSAVAQHVDSQKTTGWRAVNATNLMAMHGCGSATDPRDCLGSVPLGSDQAFGSGWDVDGRGRLRLLADVTYKTSFWTRSSPDGRFIAHGVKNVTGSYVYDLQRDMPVNINAVYDPTFFPDGSGFVFQGGSRNLCGISVLTSNPTATVTMQEAPCSNIQTIGLYQHVGQALDGDYFAIDSEFVSDDGGHEATLKDPPTHFDEDAVAWFNPMIWNGTKYTGKPQVKVATPFEGDIVLSPSAKLVISRVSGPNERQLGYVLRKVDATPAGSSYSIAAPEIARYCISGGKPGFSYDERWVSYHHYVTAADAIELGFAGPADPAFAPYLELGASNLYLMELTTGATTRVTNMAPGQYALFPHFRSDGWIYAQIRDRNVGHEYMVATDAALIAEQP